MIQEFVKIWDERKDKLRAVFAQKHPENYKEIVTEVIKLLEKNSENEYDFDLPSSKRVHEIDDGEYQGTLLYIIGEMTYQPEKYWFVRVNYGSCSGCDTLQAIYDNHIFNEDENRGLPNKKQLDDYMTLALHIIQGLKVLCDDSN